MQPHKKSVKLFVDCLLFPYGSAMPCVLVSTNSSRLNDANFHILILTHIKFCRFKRKRIRALAQLL